MSECLLSEMILMRVSSFVMFCDAVSAAGRRGYMGGHPPEAVKRPSVAMNAKNGLPLGRSRGLVSFASRGLNDSGS